jgi:DNA-binding CsgD family transcriptional regulator
VLQTPRKPQRPVFPYDQSAPREARLSRGELRVLDRLRAGANQSAIAAEFGNSVHTVRTVARNIREKFEVHSVAELLHGLEAGVYTIAAKPVSEPRAFSLSSAIGIIEREHDRSKKSRGMRTVRMHSDEISALLGLAQSYHAVVARSAQLSEDLGSVVGRVEGLVEKIGGERAVLARAVGRELGVTDAERGGTRSAAKIERLGEIFAATPFALYGDARERILDAFRTGYKVGRRDHEAKRPHT